MTKQELLVEARRISALHEQKKQLINTIFNDLDKEKRSAEKYVGGISAVNEILKEMELLEQEHSEILIKIKN